MSVASISETRVQNSVLATTLPDIVPEITNNAIDQHPGVSLFFGRLGEAMFGRVEGQGRGKTFKRRGNSAVRGLVQEREREDRERNA